MVTNMYNNREIDEKAYKYLIEGGDRTPIFYTLPKIHKKFIKNLPGRPIVSSINSPMEKISQLVDIILQSFASERGFICLRYW